MDERRLVTVLFADVVGSTALTESMDPEDARELMSRYFAHATDVLESVGGRLEKFIGDAVVAVFGIPRATGDEAERAVGGALALRAAVAQDDVLGVLLTLRIGVNLGEVMADVRSETNHFIASGDTMNTAARLQQNAEPGEILVSDRLFLAVEDGFEFGTPRTAVLKGKEGFLRVHPLIGRRARRRVERPPMVGRQQDLLQLRLTARRVIDERRAQLVTVLGPSGVGKSRLVAEFIANLPPKLGLQVITVDIGKNILAGTDPLRSLLRSLLGTEATAETITSLLARWNYGQAESLERARPILAALGDGGSVGAEAESVVAALRLLLDLCTRDRAILINIDDAQRASDLLLDLIEQAAVPRGASQLLWIVVARPELLDRRPSWGGGRGNHVSLPLQPLTDAHIESIVMHYLAGKPHKVAKQIRERAGGNPFFALEFVRAVMQNGDLKSAEGPMARLPDTVHSAVLARLDRLGPVALDALRLLAVGGVAMSLRLLQSLLPARPEQELNAGVEELLTHDIVQSVNGDRIGIRHLFFRDIAYASLARSAAIQLHTDVARALAQLGGDSPDGERHIGSHYLSAVRLSQRSAVPVALPFPASEAVPRLVAAGKAASRAAHVLQAQEYVEGALVLTAPKGHPELLELLGAMSGASPHAAEYITRAIEALPAAGDAATRERAVRLRRILLMLWLRCGLRERLQVTKEEVVRRYREAHLLAGEGVSADELRRLQAVDLFLSFESRAMQVVGDSLVERTDGRALIRTGHAIAEHFISCGDREAASEVLDGCQVAALTIGLPATALELGTVRLGLQGLPLRELGDALLMVARSHTALRDPLQGLRVIEENLAADDGRGYTGGLAHAIAFGLSLAYSIGDWKTAERIGLKLARVYEEAAIAPQDRAFCADGFLALTRIALAREENTTAARYASMFLGSLQELPTLLPTGRRLLTMEMQDTHDADFDCGAPVVPYAFGFVAFNNERGLVSNEKLIAAAALNPGALESRAIDIANALRTNDQSALAVCVAELEATSRRVTAARLRLVLAEHTGDPAWLPQARQTLEALRDIRFLRRLAAVERRIGSMRPTPPCDRATQD